MEDFFVVDRFEGQTVTLQLQVCKCQCDEQHFRRVGNSSMLYYCVWTPVSAGILALVLKLYEQIKLNCTEVNVTFVLITSGMLAASSHRYFCRIGSIFRPHYIHALHRCGLLLLMSHIAWSMCLLCVWLAPCGPGAIPPYFVTSALPHLLLYLLVSFSFFPFLFMLHLSSCFFIPSHSTRIVPLHFHARMW